MSLVDRIKRSSFFKNIAMLASGSIISQAIVVVCSPLLTRLFEVDEIGMYSYLITMVSTFTAIMNGRYDMAIVSEEKEDNIFPIIKLSLIIGFIISVVATIGFGIYFWIFKPEYSQYRYAIIFFFLLLVANALINVCTSYNNRKREYKLMTSVYVIRTGCQNIGGVILGFFKLGVFGLMLPYSIGQYLGIRRQAKTLLPDLKRVLKSKASEMKAVAKKHIQLPLFSVPAMFANSFSYSSITIFMESLFDMSVVGYYSLSTRILGLPLSLVSGNVSKVFFQEASAEFAKKRKFNNSFKKTFSFLTFLSLPMGLVIYWLAPWACQVFFGESWIVAGDYIRILTPYYMVRFVGTALTPGLIVCNKQKQELVFQLLLVATSVLSYIVTIISGGSLHVFLWSICISKSIVYVMMIIMVWHFASKYEK